MLTAVSVARDCGMIGPSHKVERSHPYLFTYSLGNLMSKCK